MTTIKIIKEDPTSIVQLKNELNLIKKRDGELNFRALRTEEYLNQFGKLKDSEELFKKIEKLQIPRLKSHHIVKIMDIMPVSVNELKTLLQGYTITVNNENMAKIIELLNKNQ